MKHAKTTRPYRCVPALLPLALAGAFAHADDAPTTTLEAVHVQASRLADQAQVLRQKMDRTTSTDLRDVLRDEPAVQFGGGRGGTSQWMTIRGMGQDQVDVVVDGASSDSQIFHHQSRTVLDPALVRVIGVEKGAGAASAGIGAVAGQIRAKTLSASDLLEDGRNVGLRVNGAAHSNQGHVRGLTLYGRSGMVDALFSANQTRLKEYKDGHNNTIKGTALHQDGYLLKLGVQPHQNHRVELSYRREELNGNRSFRNEFTSQPLMNTKHHADTYSLEYTGKNAGFADSIDFNIFHTTSQDSKTPLAPPRNPAAPSMRLGEVAMFGKTSTVGANLGLGSHVNPMLQLKYGLNWRHSKVSNRTVSGQKKTETGLYLEGIWSLEPVTLTTGVRYDHYSYRSGSGDTKSQGRINPSIRAVWDIHPHLSLNAAYTTASRSPRLGEAMIDAGTTTISPSLRGEHTRHAEVGFKYRTDAFSLSGSYYQQRISNFNRIVSNALTSDGTLKNTGYELSTRYQWRGLSASLGMAYNTPKLNGAYHDSVTSAIPLGRQWSTGLSYQLQSPKIEIGWQGRYAQRRSYTNTSGALVTRAGFGVHDLYVNWQPYGKDTFNVNLSINNVGDKYYASHSQRTSGSALREAGRDIRLSVNYRF